MTILSLIIFRPVYYSGGFYLSRNAMIKFNKRRDIKKMLKGMVSCFYHFNHCRFLRLYDITNLPPGFYPDEAM